MGLMVIGPLQNLGGWTAVWYFLIACTIAGEPSALPLPLPLPLTYPYPLPTPTPDLPLTLARTSPAPSLALVGDS